jgi:hypothetical protein
MFGASSAGFGVLRERSNTMRRLNFVLMLAAAASVAGLSARPAAADGPQNDGRSGPGPKVPYAQVGPGSNVPYAQVGPGSNVPYAQVGPGSNVPYTAIARTDGPSLGGGDFAAFGPGSGQPYADLIRVDGPGLGGGYFTGFGPGSGQPYAAIAPR